MKRNRILLLSPVLVILCLQISCAHYPVNPPLKKYDAESGYRYPSPEETVNQDELFIALSFSGGGTRAAAFSYGVLKALNNIMLPGGYKGSMLDEVDLISSVSGGSFTAAYYGLFGKRIFDDFESRFLNRDLQGELLREVLKPWNLIRLASPDFSRIDIAAELYDNTLFEKKAFQSLIEKGCHPYIAINATNLSTASQFTFTQSQFDLIGSDLAGLPVARAVAASSAFPFLLSPISLFNHDNPEGYTLPKDMELAMNDPDVNERRYMWAKNRAVYRDNKADHPFVHLMDGGLSDNLGLRYIIDGYLRTSGFLFPRKGRIRHLVVIIVNAKTRPAENPDRMERPPGLKDVAFKTATVSMDNYSFETVQVAEDLFNSARKAWQNLEACRGLIDQYCGKGHELPVLGQGFQLHIIDLNFNRVEDAKLRERLLSLPTSFSLKPDEVRDLVNTAGQLLVQSGECRELLKVLGE